MTNGNDGGVSHLADARSKRQQRARRIEALSLKLAGVSTAQIAERMGASLISIRAARRPTHRLAMSSSTTGTPRRAQLGLPTTQRLRQIQAEMTQRDQLIHFLTPSLSAGAAAGPSMSRHSPETPSRFSTGLCDPLAGHRVLSPKLKLFTDGKKIRHRLGSRRVGPPQQPSGHHQQPPTQPHTPPAQHQQPPGFQAPSKPRTVVLLALPRHEHAHRRYQAPSQADPQQRPAAHHDRLARRPPTESTVYRPVSTSA